MLQICVRTVLRLTPCWRVSARGSWPAHRPSSKRVSASVSAWQRAKPCSHSGSQTWLRPIISSVLRAFGLQRNHCHVDRAAGIAQGQQLAPAAQRALQRLLQQRGVLAAARLQCIAPQLQGVVVGTCGTRRMVGMQHMRLLIQQQHAAVHLVEHVAQPRGTRPRAGRGDARRGRSRGCCGFVDVRRQRVHSEAGRPRQAGRLALARSGGVARSAGSGAASESITAEAAAKAAVCVASSCAVRSRCAASSSASGDSSA